MARERMLGSASIAETVALGESEQPSLEGLLASGDRDDGVVQTGEGVEAKGRNELLSRPRHLRIVFPHPSAAYANIGSCAGTTSG
jgi:hypothetical protein